MTTTIKVDGATVGWINKRRSYSGIESYEVSFPQEVTLKSLHFGDISEVHKWLDMEYVGWIVA